MTGTFLALALVTMAAAAALSTGATTRMQAPWVSTESACVAWVAATPWAFGASTVAPGRSALMAASVNGWSAASHRAAVALSGSRKAMCLQFLPSLIAAVVLVLLLPQAA